MRARVVHSIKRKKKVWNGKGRKTEAITKKKEDKIKNIQRIKPGYNPDKSCIFQ